MEQPLWPGGPLKLEVTREDNNIVMRAPVNNGDTLEAQGTNLIEAYSTLILIYGEWLGDDEHEPETFMPC